MGIVYGTRELLATSLCVHMCASEMVRTSEWSEAVASGPCNSRCQELQRLGSRDSYWVSEPSCYGLNIVHTYIYFY